MGEAGGVVGCEWVNLCVDGGVSGCGGWCAFDCVCMWMCVGVNMNADAGGCE